MNRKKLKTISMMCVVVCLSACGTKTVSKNALSKDEASSSPAPLQEDVPVTEPAGQSPFAVLEYTGYLDECSEWSEYDRFCKQDYDNDGKMDRVFRDNHEDTELCDYQIEFGDGTSFMIPNFPYVGVPSLDAVDFDKDGVNELILKLGYMSTDPQAEGDVCVMGKVDGKFEIVGTRYVPA